MAQVFKTAWFNKASRKAGISDDQLCKAILQVELGQAEDLGGGVYKKRLGRNLYRSLIVARTGHFWVYAYLFAKKDRANIQPDELDAFRKLAQLYARKTSDDLFGELLLKELVEICHEN